MSNIQIKKSELITVLAKALEYAGNDSWGIYVRNDDDAIDYRHNTHENHGWTLVTSMYDAAGFENEGKYPGDDGYDYTDSAEWIVFNLGGWLPEEVEFYDPETGDVVTREFELID